MDGIALNGPNLWLDWLKPCKWLSFLSKFFEKYFQMDDFIDKMGLLKSFFASVNHKIFQTKKSVSDYSSPLADATPIKLLSVDCYDLRTLLE
jgi:hypothetical protein